MKYYDNQKLIEEVYESLYTKLEREPTQEEIDEEIFRLEQYEPDWDAIAKDDAIDRNGDY